MSRARLGVLMGLLLLPAALVAQQAYDPATAAAMSGSWIIDRERSEPVPGPAAEPEVQRGNPAAAVGGAPTGAGGGSGRRGAAPAPPSGGGFPAGARGAMRDPNLRELVSQLRAPELMTLFASDTSVIVTVQDVHVSWPPDGRKRQQALFDGTLLHNSARWKGRKVELVDGIEGSAELKREIHLIDDGAALEVKLELGGPAMPRKMSRKVVYVRQ
mgnify:CR=1 FL=1